MGAFGSGGTPQSKMANAMKTTSTRPAKHQTHFPPCCGDSSFRFLSSFAIRHSSFLRDRLIEVQKHSRNDRVCGELSGSRAFWQLQRNFILSTRDFVRVHPAFGDAFGLLFEESEQFGFFILRWRA